MKVRIFTEGGSKVGLGHLTRCCSLYDEIAARGNDVNIYINGDISNIKFLEKYNVCNCNWLSRDYLESQISIEDYCIVDSYLADEKLYDIIANNSKKVLYIDDMNRIKYPKGIVVNPSLSVDYICYNESKDKEYLLGSDYIILRSPFIGSKKNNIEVIPHRVLVTMGGSDMENITPTIIQKICNVNMNIFFDIIVGSTFTNIDYIKSVANKNTKLHYNLEAEDIKKIMIKADFAITAGGQTIYELLSVKTPFIPVKIADNQINNLNGLKKYNPSIRYVNIEEKNWVNNLVEEFNTICNYEYRLSFNKAFDGLVDGSGTKRIIDSLLGSFIEI